MKKKILRLILGLLVIFMAFLSFQAREEAKVEQDAANEKIQQLNQQLTAEASETSKEKIEE